MTSALHFLKPRCSLACQWASVDRFLRKRRRREDLESRLARVFQSRARDSTCAAEIFKSLPQNMLVGAASSFTEKQQKKIVPGR